uniref:CCHC-type domain-containing protein n=1 Tax=Setaria italica TaxID=4555 RepID=K3XSH9_SETIT
MLGDGSSKAAAGSEGMTKVPGREGMVSLQFPVLNKTNYGAWAVRMKLLMRAQGVWDVADPNDEQRINDDEKDNMAMAIISMGLGDEMLMQVAEKESAFEMWTALCSMHMGAERTKEAKVQTLCWELENLCMGNAELVDDFAAKVMLLVGQVRGLGEKIEEKQVSDKRLLRAVSDKFVHIASAIEQFEDLKKMTLEEVIGSLKAHEECVKARDARGARSEEQILMTSGRGRGRGGEVRKDRSRDQCYHCEEYGHHSYECPAKGKGKKQEEKVLLAEGFSMADDEQALV